MSKPPKSSKPSYPVPWIATYFVTAAILIVGSFAIAWYLDRPSSEFDYDDPDMRFLERIVISANPRDGDFSQLNGGDWQALCLAGFGGDLPAALKAAQIESDTAQAIAPAARGVQEQVAETEFALIYISRSGVTKAIRHPHGHAFARTGAAACTKPGEAPMRLPVGR